MKKVIVAFVLLTCSVAAFSQSEISEKKMKYGISLGLNYSNLMFVDFQPTNTTIDNGLGFNLGILADYKLTNWLSFSPKSELAFNNCKVNYSSGNSENETYEVMPINVGLMGHFVVKKQNNNVSPYLFFGPQYQLSLMRNQRSITDDFATNDSFALDFGIGLEKGFKHFNFAPELRYSYGFNNVNQNPALSLLHFHNISLIFNFLG